MRSPIHVSPEETRELGLESSLAFPGFVEFWIPVRVESKGSYVAVPATARALKDLVATLDWAAIDPRAVSHVAHVSVTTLNLPFCGLDGWPNGRSH